MNNVGKSGAILIIIGSAFMLLFSILIMILGLSFIPFGTITLYTIEIIALALSIANIVLASLALAGYKGCAITAGILGIVSIFFGVISWAAPSIFLLVGAILLFCAKTSTNKNRDAIVGVKTVQSAMQS